MHPAVLFLLITGHSMEPTFHDHQTWFLNLTPYSTLHVGSIVDYKNDFLHKPICHRIVAGWPGKWVTKGDANKEVDRGYCTPKNYIGEVSPPCAPKS